VDRVLPFIAAETDRNRFHARHYRAC
jgi:hypothetical protein